MRTILSSLAALVLLLVGCGGGPMPVAPEAPQNYISPVTPRLHYAPHESQSDIHWWGKSDGSREINIGPDVGPREPLRHIATLDGIRYFMGASRDGVGVNRLRNYENDLLSQDYSSGFFPFIIQPNLVLDPELETPENQAILVAVWDSVRILNDALPPEFQMAVYSALPGYTDTVYPGEIFINLESQNSPAWACSDNAVACAVNDIIRSARPYTTSSEVFLPDDLDTSDYAYMRSTIIHELLHALGIGGHVDSIEFPDSLMGTEGEPIPNLGYIISKIDREILQVMYMSQETDTYNDWGEWSDLSHHLMGQSEDEAMQFGVALFNGLPQPWARGTDPLMVLADNTTLRGTATWRGNLLAYSGPSPLMGDASLQVGLATLSDPNAEQDLRFRDIFYVNRYGSDSPDRWFHTRDIDYRVTIGGNIFSNVSGVGYEQGHVVGGFMGESHEHMAGTVKRTDMVGAFGGSRD